MTSSPLKTLTPAWLPLIAVAGMAVGAMGQGTTSPERLEVIEAQTAMNVAQAKVQELDAKLTKAKEQIAALGESLAAANGSATLSRDSYEKLRIQMEGLGITALDGSTAELQHRLLASLSDFRLSEERNQALTAALINLSESTLAFAAAAGNNVSEDSRQILNKSLGAAEKVLASAQQNSDTQNDADLHSAKIVSMKNELGIAVLNVGTKHGVHPGMPFSVFRADKPIGRAMVVDARQSVCGVIIQDLISEKEPVKVGDVAKVEASKG